MSGGPNIDTAALTRCIRDTLDAFLADHEGLIESTVTVEECGAHVLAIEVDGWEFKLTLGDAQTNPLLAEQVPA